MVTRPPRGGAIRSADPQQFVARRPARRGAAPSAPPTPSSSWHGDPPGAGRRCSPRPGAVIGGRKSRPPDPHLAGAPRTSHESHAPHRNRSSGHSFNLPEGRLSKSATKAPIGPERRRRIVDIPRFFSRPIPPRDVFVADLDTPPPRTIPGASPAPPRARPPPPARRSGPTDRARGRRSKNPTAPESQYGRRTQWGPGSRPHQGNPSAKKAAGVGRDGGTAEGPDRDRVTRLTGAVPANRRSPEPACAMRARRDAVRPASRRASPGDITKTTPPEAGLRRTARWTPGASQRPPTHGASRGGGCPADGPEWRRSPTRGVSQ